MSNYLCNIEASTCSGGRKSVQKDSIWLPTLDNPTTIGETIGETVGVVRNEDFALGIQSLNLKTLGGEWEKLRIGQHFSTEQKALMRSTEQEFTLKKIDDNNWSWIPIKSMFKFYPLGQNSCF